METKTKPYKIREKASKDADYRGLIRAELADELYLYLPERVEVLAACG